MAYVDVWNREALAKKALKKAFKRVKAKSRQDLLFGNKTKAESLSMKLITRFAQQHNKAFKLIEMDWWLLHMDPK